MFYFKFILSCQQSDNCSHCSPQVSFTPVAICRRCRWYRWQFATGVIDTGGKFSTSINKTSENGGKICHRCPWYQWQICRRYQRYRWQFCRWCCWYWWCTLTCKYLSKFSTKFKMVLLGYSEAGGKLIHEQNKKQKISWHCPFTQRYETIELFLFSWRKAVMPGVLKSLKIRAQALSPSAHTYVLWRTLVAKAELYWGKDRAA